MFRYAITIFVSAFLLFQVQPLIGRFILPWFGGGPSIWTSCMLFFQILLLGGYLYAHLISVKLKIRAQVITHLSLLGVSLLFLPIAPADSWKPAADQAPLLQILLLLLATVGAPYFLLSSTGPLMQKWFSQTSPNRSPYRLYALSNIGSLLALLSYPFAFEPWLTLRQQVWSWSAVYGLYVVLAAWCAVRMLKFQPEASLGPPNVSLPVNYESEIKRPGLGRMLLWLGLSACGSAMLLATTNQLCIDVATVPFLWVLPLSLYLISFIICFDSPQWYDRRAYGLLLLISCPVACWVISEGADVNITKQVAIYSTVLFACCMTCHGELVCSKPDPKYLTLFFVLTSAGGALGGIFVAIVAPYTFQGYWEYHISLVACCIVTLAAWCVQRVWLQTPSMSFWIWAVVVGAQVAAVGYFVYRPFVDAVDATQVTILFGVYGLIQLIGLILTGTLERRKAWLMFTWVAISIALFGWLFGYGLWQFSGSSGTKIDSKLSTGINSPLMAKINIPLIAIALLSPLIAAGLLWLSSRGNELLKRTYLIGTLYTLVAGCCCALFYFKWIEDWQAVSFSCTAAAALMMEWSSRGFRGEDRPSLGFWFWVPSITLILMLGNQLAEIAKSVDEPTESARTVYTSRNFYGVLRVRYEASREEDENFIPPKNSLTHGQIKHGFQFIDDYWKRQPTTYYGPESGIGLAIRLSRDWAKESDQHALRVGVVGLGTGTIAAYGKEGEAFRFYDINPDVMKLSDEIFTYLRDSAAKTDVVIGDARIVMERELAAGRSQQFDVLAIDAFSSDAIPVHLLTSECGDIYRQHLCDGGILAVHISNRFLDLNPVTRGMAEHLGWQAVRIENGNSELTGVYSSTWILLSSRNDLATNPDVVAVEEPWEVHEQVLHWTDDYSGLWQVLSF